MKKSRFLLSLLCLMVSTIGWGREKSLAPWRDPAVNGVNCLPMRADYFAFQSGEEATTKEHSSRYLSLNGPWRFLWVRHAEDRPRDFGALRHGELHGYAYCTFSLNGKSLQDLFIYYSYGGCRLGRASVGSLARSCLPCSRG